MSGLPQISGRDCVKALLKIGFNIKRQEGSHIILRRDNPFGQVVVPDPQKIRLGDAESNYSAGGYKCE